MRVLEADWSITRGIRIQYTHKKLCEHTLIIQYSSPPPLITCPPRVSPQAGRRIQLASSQCLWYSALGPLIHRSHLHRAHVCNGSTCIYNMCFMYISFIFARFPTSAFLTTIIVFSTANPINPEEQNLPFPYMNNHCNPPTVPPPPRDVLLFSFCPAADL